MEKVNARGQSFVFAKEFVIENYGEETWARIVAKLPPEAADLWKGQLVVTGVYPFAAFKSFISVLGTVTGRTEDADIARIYEHIADRSLNRLYKAFFRFANPAFAIRNYPVLWSRFFTAGEVSVPVAEKGHAKLVFSIPEIFLDWLPPACLGFSTKAVSLAGGRDLVMKPEKKALRSPDTWEVVFDLSWVE